jgi:hypothetical protein
MYFGTERRDSGVRDDMFASCFGSGRATPKRFGAVV